MTYIRPVCAYCGEKLTHNNSKAFCNDSEERAWRRQTISWRTIKLRGII